MLAWDAVSYTHLDVYKRQINHCLPIEQVTQEVIEDNQIVCQEKISQSRKQSVWDSGHIYQRLIVDTMNGNDWLSKMKRCV